MATLPMTNRLRDLTGGNVHLTRIAALVAAFIGCAIVWVIADPVAGADLLVQGWGSDEPMRINLGHVFFGMLQWGIGALIVFMLIERFSRNPRRDWMIAAVIGFVVSLFFIFPSSENTATDITLIIMHIVAAAVIVPVFLDTLRARR